MQGRMKKYNAKIAIILMIIFFLMLIFYWYEWRPNTIRKNCMAKASEDAVLDTNQPEYYIANIIDRQKLQSELINNNYLSCVRKSGLNE